MSCSGYWFNPQWQKLRELDEEQNKNKEKNNQNPNDWTKFLTPSDLPDSLVN